MSYILQNAIEIYHNGNKTILNSRIDNYPQTYSSKNLKITINGGKRRFDGHYESFGNVIIKDLRLTYDSSLEELYERLLWANTIHENNKSYFKWIYAKDLPILKLERILEEGYKYLNPYIYNVIKYIYNTKVAESEFTHQNSYL